MKTFLVKQKFRLGGERFDIKDDRGVVNYQVEGSFFKFLRPLPSMMPMVSRSVKSVKNFFTLLPRFNIQLRTVKFRHS